MREARLAFAGQAAAVAAAGRRGAPANDARRTRVRRGAALLLAAALSLGVVGGVLAASTAGGPLYGTRIWIESIMLPSDAEGRADAEVARLETRLREFEAAVRSGDRSAAAAALVAYQQIADEALAGAGASGDEAAIARLLAALDRHVTNLERVADQVPPQAAESINRNIERAIQHTDAAIERIEARPGGSNNGVGPAAEAGGAAARKARGAADAAGGRHVAPAADARRGGADAARSEAEPTPAAAAADAQGAQPDPEPPKPQPTPKPDQAPPARQSDPNR